MALRITTTRMMTTKSRWVVGQPRSEPTTASHYVPGTVSWLVPSPQQHHQQQHRYVHSKTLRAATRTHSYYHHQDHDNHHDDYEEEEDTHNPEPLPRPPNPASFSRYEAQYSYSQYARRDSRRRPSYHRHRPSSTALFPHSPEYAHEEGEDDGDGDYYHGNDDYDDYEEQEEEENNSYNDNDDYYGVDQDKDHHHHHHKDWKDNNQHSPSYSNNNKNGEQRPRRQRQQQYPKQQSYSNPRTRDSTRGYEPKRSSHHQRRPENRERQSFVSQPERSETNHNDNNPNLAWSSPQSSLTCPFTRGDKVMVEVTQFGPLGASVDIVAHASHNPQDMIATHEPPLAKGLIYQDEIRYFQQGRHNVPIVVGEVLPAYILKIKTEPPLQQEEPETEEQEQEPFGNGPQSSNNNKRSKNDDTNDLNPVELDDYGRPIHPRHRRTFSTKRSYPLYSMTDDGFFKLDICLRIFGSQAKAESVATLVLELLHKRQSTTPERATIPIGDKSSPDEIARWFPGVSKLSFKRALSALYKQGKVEPGRHSVTLLEVDKEDGTHTHE